MWVFSVTEQNSLGSISLEFSQQIVIRKCMGISVEILYVDIGVPLVRLPLNNRSCNVNRKPLAKLKIELP